MKTLLVFSSLFISSDGIPTPPFSNPPASGRFFVNTDDKSCYTTAR